MNTYYKILNEIASVFDMDQWDEQVNLFTDVIKEQLKPFVHTTKYDWIYILENCSDHRFPQYNFYKERCYVNGEKVKLNNSGSATNKWKDRETVEVIIKDLDQLGGSCECMFYACSSLVSVPKFNTSRVKNMESMFERCDSLEIVPEFNTSRVTVGMYSMFNGCSSLKTIPKFDTNRVTDMNFMFSGCRSLETVPLFDTSHLEYMYGMFSGCPSLSEETKQEWSSVYNFERHEMK